MPTLSPKIRRLIDHYPTDSATKAGIVQIYQESGQVKKLSELPDLSEKEQTWFHQGFADYVEHQDHPLRLLHSPRQWGRLVYSLSLVYYLSLSIWLSLLVHDVLRDHLGVNWTRVWMWLLIASLLNAIVTFYGIYLELIAYRGKLKPIHRLVAILAVIVLVVAIVGNVLMPLSGHADTLSLFLL